MSLWNYYLITFIFIIIKLFSSSEHLYYTLLNGNHSINGFNLKSIAIELQVCSWRKWSINKSNCYLNWSVANVKIMASVIPPSKTSISITVQGLSKDLSCLSFGQAISLIPTFLDRQKFQGRIFTFDFFGVIIKYSPTKPSSMTWVKCKFPFLTQKGIKCSCYMDLK